MTSQNTAETCKILVPIHRHLTDFETAVVGHNLSLLSNYRAVLFGPRSKSRTLAQTAEALQDITGTTIETECFGDQYFNDVYGYSWLMLKREFYERFDDVSHMLICQPDAFILSGDLQPWLASGYSFLGAPIFKGFDKPVTPLEFSGMLNGGLSLRNIADAQIALEKVTLVKKSWWMRVLRALGLLRAANFILRGFGRSIVAVPGNSHEDVIWTGPISDALQEFTLPDFESATQFAFETMPRELFEKNGQNLPFGCHAFAVYDPKFWRAHFPNWTHPHLHRPRA